MINFRTAYCDSSGVRQSGSKHIAMKYLKGWFVVDFIAAVPVQHITYAANSGDEQSDTRALKILRLVRLSRMLRVARIKRIMERYQNSYMIQQYLTYGLVRRGLCCHSALSFVVQTWSSV